MLHGTTIMPSVWNEPEDRDAETSFGEYEVSASDFKYWAVLFGAESSYFKVAKPHVERIR
jgi:hypothetical protein